MKNLNKNEHGFGAVEIILVLVIVGLLGVVGYMVYKNHNKTTPASTTITTTPVASTTPTTASTTTTPRTDLNAGYLVVKQWGVKVKLGTADSTIVEYKLDNSESETPGFGMVQGTATLSLKDSVTTNTDCKSLGIYIYRQLISDSNGTATNAKKLGNYYYGVGGSPYSCQNTKLDAIRTKYTGNNPDSWTYTNL